MKKIPLTRGMVALVDDEDWADLYPFDWSVAQGGKGGPYAARWTKQGHERMHRRIMKAPPGIEVDHLNRDGLDNRKENLRLVTHAQNCRNSSKRCDGRTSKFKGVGWYKNRWTCAIKHKGEFIYLGRFKVEEEAARAYDAAARRLFGEFANPNFPE